MEGLSVSSILGLAALFGVYMVFSRLYMLSRSAERILNMLRGIEGDALRLKETPKSVSAMTKLELPRIEKDFPEFNWPEWRQRSENILKGYLEAVEHKDCCYLKDAGYGLKEQVRLAIQDAYERDITEKFDAVKVHRCEIARYQKEPFLCRVAIQLSVEYLHSLEDHGINKPLQNEKEQHRYELEIVYVQDVSAIGHTEMGVGVNCPNCGAPVSDLGVKVCAYCGTEVEPLNIRVWVANKISEV